MGRLRQLFCKHKLFEIKLNYDTVTFRCVNCDKEIKRNVLSFNNVIESKIRIINGLKNDINLAYKKYNQLEEECRFYKQITKDYKIKCKLVELQKPFIKNNKLFAINMLKELQLQVIEDKTNIDKLIEEKIDYLEKG